MTKLETLQLKLTATRVRMGIIEATHGGKSGHPGGRRSGHRKAEQHDSH